MGRSVYSNPGRVPTKVLGAGKACQAVALRGIKRYVAILLVPA
jgi:hypothetical protein